LDPRTEGIKEELQEVVDKVGNAAASVRKELGVGSVADITQIRKRTHHEMSFDERIAERAREARAQAKLLPPGELRNALLEKGSPT
jgi:hypothetical protein